MSQVLTKSYTPILAWQDIASAAEVISSVLDVSTKFAATFFIKVARLTGSAFTAGSPNIRIEASGLATGNDDWLPLVVFQPALGASIAATTLNGAVLAGANSFVVTSATAIAAGDLLFLGDAATANYELVRVKSVSGTTITPEEAVTFAHANGALVTDQAEVYVAQIDCTALTRLRAVADNIGSGQGIKAQVLAVTADSIG